MRATDRLLALCQLLFLAYHPAAAQNATSDLVGTENPLNELYYVYNRSPPVYPSPEGTGLGDWGLAYSRARELVAQMTNEEKENIAIGYSDSANGCSGNSGNVTRLGYPGMCLNDAGNGLRGTEGTSGYPSGLHVGASWNKELTLARAQYMGREFKKKGVTVALGPVVSPLGRIALDGRNWEGFSDDPYLSGSLTFEHVTGIQQSVVACTKHFIAYEQETDRQPTTTNASVSSNLDDKTIHELYLWPFVDAVRAGTGAIMCSYNRVNGSYACQNSKTLNGLLKTELAFQGFVVSDWGGQHTGIASANAGLDMAMPDSVYWSGNLTLAVSNGSMTQERLDDMATRIVATWYQINAEPDPGHSMPPDLTAPHAFTNGRNPASKETIFQGAVEGHVLVKNEGVLPLKAPAFLSLFGYDATVPQAEDVGDLWDDAYESVNATLAEVELIESGDATSYPDAAYRGTIICGGGSGGVTPAYISAPFDAIQEQAYRDNTYLLWDFVDLNPAVDPASTACLVFINQFASEGYDRPSLTDDYSDTLVLNVASQCANTIVSIHNAGIRIVDAWIDHPNITAVIYSHLPGQDSGRALASLLYGYQSFSGRLPYTVGKTAADYGYLLEPAKPNNSSDYYLQANFTEGVYIDYRSFIQRNVTPRYEFGYGLTYSTFTYADLAIAVWPNVSHAPLPAASAQPGIGGAPSLWDQIARVSVLVTNTGDVAAAEVAQLYVGIPGAPARQLRGYAKPYLLPGESELVVMELTRRDLSVWDTGAQAWALQGGEYGVYVGKSVLDVQLTGTITI